MAGLVGITPAAGYVNLWCAAAIGFLTAVVCALCQNANNWLNIDEGLHVFTIHGIGGMVGSFLTGVFATSSSTCFSHPPPPFAPQIRARLIYLTANSLHLLITRFTRSHPP
jgi:ammonia channel protein AmtB